MQLLPIVNLWIDIINAMHMNYKRIRKMEKLTNLLSSIIDSCSYIAKDIPFSAIAMEQITINVPVICSGIFDQFSYKDQCVSHLYVEHMFYPPVPIEDNYIFDPEPVDIVDTEPTGFGKRFVVFIIFIAIIIVATICYIFVYSNKLIKTNEIEQTYSIQQFSSLNINTKYGAYTSTSRQKLSSFQYEIQSARNHGIAEKWNSVKRGTQHEHFVCKFNPTSATTNNITIVISEYR
eukprot:520482_1